jgi:hypothetical protein
MGALQTHGPLSSAELTPLCASAFDIADISRVLYDLKRSGAIEIADERIIGGKGKPIKFYRLIGDKPPTKVNHKPKSSAESIEDEPVTVQPRVATVAPTAITAAEAAALEAALTAPPLDTQAPVDYAEAPIDYEVDDIEVAIRALQDHADAALLAVADLLLADHPLWRSLRQIADDTHHIHCHYRLLGVGANHV